MTKRGLILLLVISLISSVFSVIALAEGETTIISGDPDEAVKEIFTAEDETYERTAYDTFGWILWTLLGAVFTVAVIIISKWTGGKIHR